MMMATTASDQPATGQDSDGLALTTDAPSVIRMIGGRGLARMTILGGLLVAVYFQPIKTTLIHRWINDGTWSYGWLVPLLSLYFLSHGRETLGRITVKPAYAGLVVLVASLGCYLATTWIYHYSYPRVLTLVGCIVGLTLFLGGWAVLRAALFPILFLIFAIPLPQGMYVDLTMPLQRWASLVTASILSMLPNVYAEVSGVVVDYTHGAVSGHLNVEQACSGMRSMMAIITLGVATAYLGDRPRWQRITMVIACLPIAVACNTVRVTATGLLHVYQDSAFGRQLHFDWLTGPTPHAMLGLATFLIAVGLFSLVGWVLSNLLIDEADPKGNPGAESR